MKFRLRATLSGEVEAYQYTGTNADFLIEFTKGAVTVRKHKLYIIAGDGEELELRPSDYVIKGPYVKDKETFYPLGNESFFQLYYPLLSEDEKAAIALENKESQTDESIGNNGVGKRGGKPSGDKII